jgi:hypothetical protein
MPLVSRLLLQGAPMEGLAHLVTESLVRHGFKTTFDHRRLQWSAWFPCQDSLSLIVAPSKPGLYAVGEEVAAFSGLSESPGCEPERSLPNSGKRMLALFQISEADDLGFAMGRLFLAPGPQRERIATGKCFARYVVIEDATQRRAALAAFQRWMASSVQAVFPGEQNPSFESVAKSVSEPSFLSGHDFKPTPSEVEARTAFMRSVEAPESSNKQAQIGPPAPIPSGF